MSRAVRNVVPIKGTALDPLTIIIPTAGEGCRMKAYGTKSLIKIKDNLTILEYQIQLVRKRFGPYITIIVVSGFESDKIVTHSPESIIHVENERYSETSVVHSIGLGLKATITNRALIIYGDLIFNYDTLLQPLDVKSLLFIDTSNTMTENEVGCIITDGRVENLMYDLPNKWAQIIYLTGKELKLCRQYSCNPTYEKWLGFELLNLLITKGGRFFQASPLHITANDIDCSKDIQIAQGII